MNAGNGGRVMGGKGGFTLPGEAGYEELTLKLAEKWGADCIRDSDGTQLSGAIIRSGIPIYSTLCLPRSINAWARENPDKLQRNFLLSRPVLAQGTSVEISPLKGYFTGQFTLCDKDDPYRYWQVYDRTAGKEHKDWAWDAARGVVTVRGAEPWHDYTVSFMATRVWEEISMYNHITNGWGEREHLMAVEPRYPETRAALLAFLTEWLDAHPDTAVVRLTSLFYNFSWFWSDDPANRTLFADWGSYDFTVNPPALEAFEKEYGYSMVAEDFVNAGHYRATHNPPTARQLDWMAFTGRFVRQFGGECVDLIHRYGKKAYVFYDDSWIGLEPWNGHFGEFGFDGLIKCVFSGFEARLCAGAAGAKVKELRLHPYLFPTGLGGEPTFAAGGHPEQDARRYWISVRRALLRVKVDRIGLGGYLHLTEPFPDFVQAIADIADEFRALRALHETETPWDTGVRVGILQSWGSLRTWNCAGHMHEHPELPLNHLYEALAGLPVSVRAISLAEAAENGVPDDIDVLINAGRAGDAWSGGEAWRDPRLAAHISAFVSGGGGLIGVKEPSQEPGGMRLLRLANILGVDREIGHTICNEKYRFTLTRDHFITGDLKSAPAFANASPGAYALSGDTQVLAADGADILLSAHETGRGRAVYMAGFTYIAEHARLLLRAILYAAGQERQATYCLPDNPACDCAWFEGSRTLALANTGNKEICARVLTSAGPAEARLAPMAMAIIKL
jgi:beta-D-galactosyl-(1->4)-L-rhamnose phosphorylase